MTLDLFLTILVMSGSAASIAAEIIKTFLNKAGLAWRGTAIAIITAFTIGVAEMAIYYTARQTGLTVQTALSSLCMGVANVISATCGYDLTKKFIYALMGKEERG